MNKGLEEGRSLLNNPQHTNSLAAEFEAMSENEVRAISRRVVFYAGNVFSPLLGLDLAINQGFKGVSHKVFEQIRI